MKFFNITLWDCTEEQIDAILAVMWRVAYFVSHEPEQNGYTVLTYGTTQNCQPSITEILHKIGIVNFLIKF